MLPFGALAVACLGRGGVCRAVVDVPLAQLGSAVTLRAALAEIGWDLCGVANPSSTPTRPAPGWLELRCPECRAAG